MTYTDNINVRIPLRYGMSKADNAMLTMFEDWLKENNVKYTKVYSPFPLWTNFPCAINMRNEDATAFKLRFDL